MPPPQLDLWPIPLSLGAAAVPDALAIGSRLGRRDGTHFVRSGTRFEEGSMELRRAMRCPSEERHGSFGSDPLSVGGKQYEVAHGYLAGQIVTAVTTLFDGAEPFVEADGRRVGLAIVNPVDNSRRRRPDRHPEGDRAGRPVDFDPSRTLTTAVPATDEVAHQDIFSSGCF